MSRTNCMSLNLDTLVHSVRYIGVLVCIASVESGSFWYPTRTWFWPIVGLDIRALSLSVRKQALLTDVCIENFGCAASSAKVTLFSFHEPSAFRLTAASKL